MSGDRSVFLAGRAVRLFKRGDRPTRFWQAAFRRPGKARPLVKSTGQAELAAAKAWALDQLARLDPAQPGTDAATSPLGRENLLAPYPFPKIRQEKRHVERELALRVLAAYRDDPLLSQRRLAQALNVSLAVVNTYTGRCVRDGWLSKLNRPLGRGSGYRYQLTGTGREQLNQLQRAFVAEELALYRHLRAEFTALLQQYGADSVILVGSGEIAEIARAVLAAHDAAPLLVVTADSLEALNRHAIKRHKRHAVLWLTEPGDDQAIRDFAARHLPFMPVVAPTILAPLHDAAYHTGV